jgi:hypothetical protein
MPDQPGISVAVTEIRVENFGCCRRNSAHERYTQPLLTRHEPLIALTGKSAEKDPAEKPPDDKDPQEKCTDGGGTKPTFCDKDPNEKTKEFEGAS